MARINGDVIFVDTSGQVRATRGDLTLRADDTGTGYIIVGSGLALVPEVDCNGPEPKDLGVDWLRWNTLFACSGNFLDRPTVNGSGVLLQGEVTGGGGGFAGVDTINGISGVVTLASVNDAITITENGQTIEFSGIFTQASGACLENIADLVSSGVVNQLNGLSGLVTIASGVSQIIQVTSSAESGILLDLDISLLEDALSLSGITKLEASVSEPFQESTSTSFVEVLTLPFTVDTSGTYRCQWSFQGGCSAANKICEFRLQLDDSVLISDFMNMTTSFNVGGTGDGLQFGGFIQFGVDVGSHDVDFDFRYNDTGGKAVQVSNLRIEVLQVL